MYLDWEANNFYSSFAIECTRLAKAIYIKQRNNCYLYVILMVIE